MQSDCSDQSLISFINKLGFVNFDIELIKIAFTHSSYTKDNDESYYKCYERLEFLGDAVLKLAVTDYLYSKYPEKHEGELTKIRGVVVSDEILHKVALKLSIEPYIKVGSAEYKSDVHKLESVQACVMEALFGALYLSSDKEFLSKFIAEQLKEYIDDIVDNNTIYNAKALLQEYTQSKTKELPVYEIVGQSGKAHEKLFKVSVSYNGQILATADGKTKKHAQQDAAFCACKKLGLIKDSSNE